MSTPGARPASDRLRPEVTGDTNRRDTMRTATVRDLRNNFAAIAVWLDRGETIVLTRRGRRVAQIVPEPGSKRPLDARRRALFARRFAGRASVPGRDLAGVVVDNRGEA